MDEYKRNRLYVHACRLLAAGFVSQSGAIFSKLAEEDYKNAKRLATVSCTNYYLFDQEKKTDINKNYTTALELVLLGQLEAARPFADKCNGYRLSNEIIFQAEEQQRKREKEYEESCRKSFPDIVLVDELILAEETKNKQAIANEVEKTFRLFLAIKEKGSSNYADLVEKLVNRGADFEELCFTGATIIKSENEAELFWKRLEFARIIGSLQDFKPETIRKLFSKYIRF